MKRRSDGYPQMTQMKGMRGTLEEWKFEAPLCFYVIFVAKNSSMKG
jgi:hypothetical protein